jgi:biotin carboxyl carrier protein
MKLKVSGKKIDLPEAPTGWKLTPRPGGWIVAEGPEGERRRIACFEARGRLGASLGGTLYLGDLIAKERGGGGSGGSDSDLVAQFPGKVRKILVREGAQVAEGEPLVLIEAMKMEFAVKAPFAGKVVRVLVQEAQQLSPGDRFVELEKTAP